DQSLTGVEQIEVSRARLIVLDLDGHTQSIEAISNSPANMLSSLGIRIFPGDSVFVDGQRVAEPSTAKPPVARLALVRARTLAVTDDGRQYLIRTSAATLGAALQESGRTIYAGDLVTPPLNTPIETDLDVQIIRAERLSVQVDGREMQILAVGNTVGEALASAGVVLTHLDYSIPAVEDQLPESRSIKIVRVEEAVQVELEPVPFETVYQPLDTLELDSIQVVNAGTYGVLQNRVRIRLEDGVEISRTVDEARVVVEPEPRILGYGTKIVVRTLSTSYGTIEYWRSIPIYATSYSPCNLGVSYCGDRTASGKSVQRGIIGVIRSWYNLMRGWPVFVPNYGPGTIEDIGGGIAGRDWIDLGFTDENFEPWHQWTTLYFLTPVPPLDSIPWILP
ncbi:MAG: ubiquitin-like domain-containing protein, partial [Anaerolineales bacterium]